MESDMSCRPGPLLESATRLSPADILAKSASLVSTERAASHGPFRENHENIAFLWTGWLKAKYRIAVDLKPEDVAEMMSLLKKARKLSGDFNADDYYDDAAYTAIAGAIRSGDTGR